MCSNASEMYDIRHVAYLRFPMASTSRTSTYACAQEYNNKISQTDHSPRLITAAKFVLLT
ncbi:hypothetical protein Mapa_008947 [Marchantia paleacea]|nr:hypothetical protein Mapa_008947 [Marchantia paleacea]